MSQAKKPGWGTRSVWSGENPADNWQGATQVPVVKSVSFGYPNLDDWLAVAREEKPGYIYGRNRNPTVAALERKLAELESAPAALAFTTGMAAISSTLFALLKPGDRVVSVKDTYGGTNVIFQEFLPRFNIRVELIDTDDPAAIEAALSRGCQALYLETPTNPTLKVLDLERLARAGRAAGATVIVDNTFATPINQNPLSLGADLVLHSATKFLGGHADVLGGLVAGSDELIAAIYHFREIIGTIIDPEAAYTLLRSMKTLQLRVERQCATALDLAQWLAGQPQVDRVFYPGLAGHPGHDIAARQMRGFGGVLSFMLQGGLEAVGRFLPRLKLANRAANLGAVETVVGPPATTSHVECTPEERQAMGIPEGLIRYSTGLEDAADLKADLAQALAAV